MNLEKPPKFEFFFRFHTNLIFVMYVLRLFSDKEEVLSFDL